MTTLNFFIFSHAKIEVEQICAAIFLLICDNHVFSSKNLTAQIFIVVSCITGFDETLTW